MSSIQVSPPAFPQLALIHEWHRDGVNHVHPHQQTVAVYWQAIGSRLELKQEHPAVCGS